MLDGERLVWAAAAIALTTAFGVTLLITRARSTAAHGRDGHDVRLFANVLALGLLVVVLVAVAFVCGYAALERRTEYVIIAISVLGIGLVLYNDATRPQRDVSHTPQRSEVPSDYARVGEQSRVSGRGVASPGARTRDSIRSAPCAGERFDSVFAHASSDQDPAVLAAAARAEACVTRPDAESEADPGQPEMSPYTLGVRFGRIPRS